VQELNADPVIPEGFPEWSDVMNSWGRKMIAAVEVNQRSICLDHRRLFISLLIFRQYRLQNVVQIDYLYRLD
jgi:hypothetical protein